MTTNTTPTTNAVKCDGNHADPRCQAETCWHDDPPANRCQFCDAIGLAQGIYNCHSYLCREREARQKAEAELAEIRSALGDDGRRTHKEILEMAFKASGWKLWKEKYIDLRNAHIAEGQDPAGTIWEHADKLQKELKASKAEVERLREELERAKEMVMEAARRGDKMAAHWKERAEKAEALVKQIHHYAGIIEGFQTK
jgi:ElaB/YqjD/DUF883 family membrane-anchored ribosome-binding protein